MAYKVTNQNITPLAKFLNSVSQIRNSNTRAALYADLELLKSTNPEGYKQNIEIWKQLIMRASRIGVLATPNGQAANGHQDFDLFSEDTTEAGGAQSTKTVNEPLPNVTCLDSSKLPLQFTVGDDTPMGIDIVLLELTRSGSLVPYDQFFLPQSVISKWTKWLIGGLPIASSILYPTDKDKVSWYVSVSNVKIIANKILKIQKESIKFPATDCLMTIDTFRHKFASIVSEFVPQPTTASGKTTAATAEISEIDTQVIIKYLIDQTKITTTTSSLQNMVIKFAHPDKSHAEPTTQTDADILKLTNSRNRVKLQVDELQNRVQELDKSIRDALQKKQKNIATSYLKMRKHVENSVLPTRISALTTLDEIVSKIQASESDASIIAAYQLGTETLREFNQRHGLTIDKVDDVLDDLNEVLADQAEVDEIMRERVTESDMGSGIASGSLMSNIIIDEDELERELEILAKESEPEPEPEPELNDQEPQLAKTEEAEADEDELYKSFLKLKLNDRKLADEQKQKQQQKNESEVGSQDGKVVAETTNVIEKTHHEESDNDTNVERQRVPAS